MIDFIIRYKREGADLCTGELLLCNGDQQNTIPFSGVPFPKVLWLVHEQLAEATPQKVVIQRTDRDGLRPVALPVDTVMLLQKDPVAAIRSMNFSVLPSVPSRPLTPVLLAGHDALAEAFGDNVYCVRIGDCFECPACGGSRPLTGSCPDCRLGANYSVTDNWAHFAVEALLESESSQFYLPRRWNTEGPWITNKALEALWLMWKKEKESFQ